MVLQVLTSGLMMGFVYALVAVGLSIIWGVMDVINFAHGEFLMVSMYSAFWLYTLVRLDPLFSWPIEMAIVFALGYLTYKVIIRRVVDAPGLA
ncbi:MAG: branched-chain amino acid ABC transporter permease, partial [Bacillota bacterium]|nr:branched-chain amino acid ABC transporter permease [Bacillota bacterium]